MCDLLYVRLPISLPLYVTILYHIRVRTIYWSPLTHTQVSCEVSKLESNSDENCVSYGH